MVLFSLSFEKTNLEGGGGVSFFPSFTFCYSFIICKFFVIFCLFLKREGGHEYFFIFFYS
jgi:hypothetical protein